MTSYADRHDMKTCQLTIQAVTSTVTLITLILNKRMNRSVSEHHMLPSLPLDRPIGTSFNLLLRKYWGCCK